MKLKYKNGGVIKLQNAGSLPKWMQKLNAWSNKNIPQSDESAGERIQNKTIEKANSAKTKEERDKIYKDSAKTNLAVTGQSLMMLPMLGEFTTYGLLGGGLRIGTGMAGSKAGEYVLGKGGDWADKQLNTNFLGTTGRIIGGLGGWWGGSSATTPLFRNLAGKGITFHMPQETFSNLRGQYFDRTARNIKLDDSVLPKLQYHDRLMKDYLEFGPNANIYGDDVSKLVHWDPMTTGTKSALPINGGFNRDPMHFPHFENGKLVPAIGEIQSKMGNGQMYKHPYHPIFFGGNKPWWETRGSNLSDLYLKETTFDKSKFTGPKQYYNRWAKRTKQNLRTLRNWYEKYGPQNKSDRYLITDPENLKDYEFSYKLGIMGSEVPMSKLEGFEYDPLLGTFKRARYIDPSTAIISPQTAATTYHGLQNTFDDISQIPEPLGIGYSGYTPTKNVFNQRFVDDVIEAVKMANARGPIEEPKTTLFDIDKLKEIGRGAEHIVYEYPTDPNKVLKIPYGGERRGIQNVLDYGKWYISANDPLYNMRLNIEGLTKENQYGFQSPVFSQYKLQTLPDYAKSLEEAKALRLAIDKFALRIGADPIYNWKLKLPVNNVILENTEFIRTGGKDFKPDNIGFTKDGLLMGYDLHKQGGIIKGQNGFLNTWQKAYNSKFGKGLRDFMFGKDSDLSDEEYFEKYGYNKPVGSIGVLGALVAPEWEGLEIPEITAQHIGNQGKVLRWFESGNSKMLKVPVKETSKKVSNWQKFLKLSQQEQDDFVRRWNGESFQGFATLKGDKQALSKFRSWINSRK